MTFENIQTSFAREAISQNMAYFKARGLAKDHQWDFDFPPSYN